MRRYNRVPVDASGPGWGSAAAGATDRNVIVHIWADVRALWLVNSTIGDDT
jgi:hypothetical protein